MSKNLKLVKRIAAVATTVCVVAGMMVSASAYGITVPAEGRFVYDGTESSVTVPVTGTSSSGQVTIVVRRDSDAWLTDPNSNVVFIDQVTGAEGATSITFGIDNKWLSANETFKIFVGGSSQTVTSADIYIGGETPPEPVKTLTSIAVSGQKTTYNVGDTFVAPTVTASYSDGSTAVVTATFSGYNMATAGTQTVTVTFEDQTTTYTITVNEVKPPVDGDYIFGQVYEETFDMDGKAVIDLTLVEGNGTMKVTVGGAELYYSTERGLYIGIIDANKLNGEEVSDLVITNEAPTAFFYGNVDGDYDDVETAEDAIDSSDLAVLKRFNKNPTLLTGAELLASDLDGDGLSDSSDLLALKNYIKSGKQFGILK